MRRSALKDAEHASRVPSSDVLLVDSTGELRAWHHLATVVIIGKSFLATGGQNPAEAVAAGKPVVFGPHMENFQALVRILLANGGAMQVKNLDELEQTLRRLLENDEDAGRMASAGLEALRWHEGSTRRTAALLLGAAA